MANLGCMTTGIPIAVTTPMRDDDTIVVLRHGQVIGVLSEDAQAQVKTIRMTFTREDPDRNFEPLQGVAVAVFETPQVSDVE